MDKPPPFYGDRLAAGFAGEKPAFVYGVELLDPRQKLVADIRGSVIEVRPAGRSTRAERYNCCVGDRENEIMIGGNGPQTGTAYNDFLARLTSESGFDLMGETSVVLGRYRKDPENHEKPALLSSYVDSMCGDAVCLCVAADNGNRILPIFDGYKMFSTHKGAGEKTRKGIVYGTAGMNDFRNMKFSGTTAAALAAELFETMDRKLRRLAAAAVWDPAGRNGKGDFDLAVRNL
jgi:hypothetical protein